MPDFPSPLPLVAFEEYMLWDDRPKFPMSIIARFRFAGQLDRRATAEALATVVARHPLLRAKIRQTPAGRLEWTAAEDGPPAIAWIDGPADDRLPLMQPIDLFSGPGLRVWAAADAPRGWLVLQVHHAACDGKAVMQVAGDFLQGYARAVDPEHASIDASPCDAAVLRGRGTFGLTALKYLRILPGQLIGLLGVRQFLMRQPVPAARRGGCRFRRTADELSRRESGQPGSRRRAETLGNRRRIQSDGQRLADSRLLRGGR